MPLQPGRFECPSCADPRGFGVDEKGHGYCFACSFTTHQKHESPFMAVASLDLITDFKIKAIPERSIGVEACRRYNYGQGTFKGKPAHFANYHDDLGQLVGQKVRIVETKEFVTIGRVGGLWGQSKMRDTGKMVVVTEGELDCMAVSECLGNKWPVVSLPQGTMSADKHIKASLEWLERFDRVVLCFDNDSSGKKALEKCRELFSPGKVRLAHLPRKDPCELLQANERDKLIDCIWNAPSWVPGGILAGASILAAALDRSIQSAGDWPWPSLSATTSGLRYRELVTLCAGTGIGKSTVCRELAAHFLGRGETSVGYLALEESPRTTALGIYGVHANAPLMRGGIYPDPSRLPFDDELEARASQEKHESAVRTAHSAWGDRLFLFDHFGSADPDTLLSRIRYLVVGLGCRVIILDHLSIVISGLELDDERRAIDTTMTKLRELVQQTGCLMILVSHLKRTQGRGHEIGEEVSLNQLRGSQSISQLSDLVVALERNQQDEDEDSRHSLRIRVLKNRHTGRTGPADVLKYDYETGRLRVGEAPKMFPDESEF
jgi:twinkle protein